MYEVKCEFCPSVNVVRNGTASSGRQRWLCRDCNRTFGRPSNLVHKARRHKAVGFGAESIAGLLNVTVETVEDWIKDAS